MPSSTTSSSRRRATHGFVLRKRALTSGVALRVNDSPPEFRVFPYENIYLEPFEAAVQKLNPVVAVKVRSAAVHAALADVPPDATNIYVDNNTRIQIIDTMLQLPQADREQCAAFIRDERVLVVSLLPSTPSYLPARTLKTDS